MKLRDKLRIGGAIVKSKITGRPRPFFVQYALSHRCDGRCSYCNCFEQGGDELTLAQHLQVLREFAALGAVRIKLLGGEPLLYPHVAHVVEEIRSLGMRSAMTTNGHFVESKLDVVKQLDERIISIDGREEAHNAQRGAGSWRKVMRAIEICSAEQLDFFLTAVVTSKSIGEIDWLIELARKHRVMVNFQLPQHNSHVYGSQARQWLPSPESAHAVLRQIIAAKAAGAPVLFTANSYRHTLEWPDFFLERTADPQAQSSSCMAGRYFVHMEPNGDLYPCILQMGDFVPKNVICAGVQSAWEHTRHHGCQDCYNTWLTENRAIFDLHPAVLLNFWRNYLAPNNSGAQQSCRPLAERFKVS